MVPEEPKLVLFQELDCMDKYSFPLLVWLDCGLLGVGSLPAPLQYTVCNSPTVNTYSPKIALNARFTDFAYVSVAPFIHGASAAEKLHLLSLP